MNVLYDFAEFRVDSRQRLLLLRDSGKALPLSSRAFDTLLFFLENRGKLLDKSTLMAAVWPHVVVEENNLNQHISALRRVLGETRDDHRFIVTEPGRGYRFVADVTTSTAAQDASVPPAAEPVPAPVPVPHAVPHSRVGRLGWMIGTIAAAVIVGAAIWWFAPQLHETSAPGKRLSRPSSQVAQALRRAAWGKCAWRCSRSRI
jgi:DNA-binding winged helix-turn-helix (wHTH) protein